MYHPIRMHMIDPLQNHMHKTPHLPLPIKQPSLFPPPLLYQILQLHRIIHQLHDQVHVPIVIVGFYVFDDVFVVEEGENRNFFMNDRLFIYGEEFFLHDFDGYFGRAGRSCSEIGHWRLELRDELFEDEDLSEHSLPQHLFSRHVFLPYVAAGLLFYVDVSARFSLQFFLRTLLFPEDRTIICQLIAYFQRLRLRQIFISGQFCAFLSRLTWDLGCTATTTTHFI